MEMTMKPKEIKKLIELVEHSNINELEVSRWGKKVRILKSLIKTSLVANAETVTASSSIVAQPSPVTALPHDSSLKTETTEVVLDKTPANLIEVKSPMVGTFYRAPAPDADPYVQVGDIVSPDQVLCIIEAMKLMNEIEAEERGRVVEILVENSQPVEYNQVLFRIEKL